MSKVVAMKIEKIEDNQITSIQAEPALVINFTEKRAAKIQKQINQFWANDGIKTLRTMIADYEVLMNVLATQISEEQLAEYTPLTANDQISEDLRRLNTLVDALEYIVNEKVGTTLEEALSILKNHGTEEMAMVIEYLQTSDYPVFVAMMKVIGYTSVRGQDEAVEGEMNTQAEVLMNLGAVDSVNGIHFLLATMHVQTVAL